MKTFRSVVSRLARNLNTKTPIWLTFAFLIGGYALASPPILHASLSVPSGGSISDANNSANNCVGINASGAYVYGAQCVQSVTSNGDGTITVGGSANNPTLAVGGIGQANVTNGYVDTATNQTVGGTKIFSNELMASYLASSATAGSVDALQFSNATNATTGIFASNSASINGVTGAAMAIAHNGGANLATMDNSGDVGMLGNISTKALPNCASNSALPCMIGLTCTTSSSTTCTNSNALPRAANCVGSFVYGACTFSGLAMVYETESTSTMAIHVTLASAQTATASVLSICA